MTSLVIAPPATTTEPPARASAALVPTNTGVVTSDEAGVSVNVVIRETPATYDPLVEEPMDYTPIPSGKLAAPNFPDEEWPEDSGPLGF